MPVTPSFVQAGTGVVIATGSSAVTLAGVTVGNLVVLHTMNDATSIGYSLSSHTGYTALDGGGGITDIGAFAIGSPTAALQNIWLGWATATSISVTMATSGPDQYVRWYEFSNVNKGSSSPNVIENAESILTGNTAGTSIAVTDTSVTTNGPNRLCVQFIGVDDDNALSDFTGETGGNWTEATAEFASATGTDGCIGLQTSVMETVGTINGGSFNMAASDNWGVVGFAFKPAELPEILIPPYRYW